MPQLIKLLSVISICSSDKNIVLTFFLAGAEDIIHYWLDAGAPKSKLTLGIPFYAKYFETAAVCTSDQLPIGCPTKLLEDAQGEDTGASGALTFTPDNSAQLQPILAGSQWDQTNGAPWYYDASTMKFWTWDSPKSITEKCQGLAVDLDLAGMVFNCACRREKFAD